MAQTVLITGASTGIGKATALRFQKDGFNVVATMRSPEKETELTAFDNVLVTRLDVTEPASIAAAVDEAVTRFGGIDILVNNAGYGAYGPLESFPMDRVRRQFDTNVLGLIEVTKHALPHMRKNKAGTVVNISSIGGKMTFPLGALYHGTKFAVEGISEALHFELEPLGIRVKIVEPGAIATDFGGRSFDFEAGDIPDYAPIVQHVMAAFPQMMATASPASLVADVIMTAVTDGSDTLRYTAGEDAVQFMANRKALDDKTFIGGLKQQMGLDELVSLA